MMEISKKRCQLHTEDVPIEVQFEHFKFEQNNNAQVNECILLIFFSQNLFFFKVAHYCDEIPI